MDISSIIAKSKQKKFLEQGDTAVRAFIDAKVQDLATQAIEQIVPKLFKEVTEGIEGEIKRLTKDVKKGDKGDTPVVGVDFEQPKDGDKGDKGDDYILTRSDKEEIASFIEVPVVEKVIEKTEVIKPIVTEIAKHETAEQIIDKINSLEERVEIKAIKGLTNWLNNLKKSIREKSGGGGGGGMGLPVHESLPLTSATTSVSTSARIAANGYALWVFYQGQMVARGVGYTVSGQTISLLFTPVDGTYLDIMFIRT